MHIIIILTYIHIEYYFHFLFHVKYINKINTRIKYNKNKFML